MRAAERAVSPEQVRMLIDYDPETGALTWKARTPDQIKACLSSRQAAAENWNKRWARKPALASDTGTGHLAGALLCHRMHAHRVAWAHYYGEWPTGDIDHIDGDGRNNRLANLRCVAHQENQRNMKLNANNKSGHHGVYRVRGGWTARIKDGGRFVSLGTFSRKADAATARKAAELRLGYHPNHGREPVSA